MDKLYHLGFSISYDRVLRLSAEMGNSVCQRFHMEQVVCPPILQGGVFTTAAVDNIDHNPSATTAKDSLHGTAISLIQHPSCAGEGVDRGVVIIRALPSPCNWGWIKTKGLYEPHWTTLPEASKTCYELVSCVAARKGV